MASPKTGSPGTAVDPAEPTEAEQADSADPGEVAEVKARQRATKKGKYGKQPVQPYSKEEQEAKAEDKPVHWIEIELIDENDQPVAGERYKITLPDGSVDEGSLDDKGKARIDSIADAGDCKISFPELDQDAWEKA
jgi:hypothetical protein